MSGGNLYYSPTVVKEPQLEWSFNRINNKTKLVATTQTIENISNYTLYYTTDVDNLENYTSLNTAIITEDGQFTFSFNNLSSGTSTYYFVLLDNSTGKNYWSTLTIDFESLNNTLDNNYTLPPLQWSFERKDGVITMSSQALSQNDIHKYILYYSHSSDDFDNYKNWNTADFKSITYTDTGVTNYHYYLTFNAISDLKEFTYYFVYEDGASKESYYSSVTIDLDSLNAYFDMKVEEEEKDQLADLNNTNKNIFERIGEMLSYINPLSENFFAYKLIELLVDAIKSLFIPSDDFFSNWLDDLNEYFGDTFGILYYPFELVVDFFNRINSLEESSTAIITTPEFKLMDTVLLQSYTYNFYDILQNDTFKTVHTIYLYVVDIILWLGVVLLCKNMLVTFIGGVAGEAMADERSYSEYSQHRANVSRYNKEHNVKPRRYIRKK